MSPQLPQYQCHKIVGALKIAAILHKPNPDTTGQSVAASYGAVITPADEGYTPFHVSPEFVMKHRPEAGGYYVVYEDGYASFSPAKAFEDGYTLVPADYRDRVRLEAKRMSTDLAKLCLFMGGNVFPTLPAEERKRLVAQRDLMQALLKVLNLRIESFDRPQAPEEAVLQHTEDPDHAEA